MSGMLTKALASLGAGPILAEDSQGGQSIPWYVWLLIFLVLLAFAVLVYLWWIRSREADEQERTTRAATLPVTRPPTAKVTASAAPEVSLPLMAGAVAPAVEVTAPAVPEVTLPPVPEVVAPAVEVTAPAVPEVTVPPEPEVVAPAVEVEAPAVPEVAVPPVPEVVAPAVEGVVPTVPEVAVPPMPEVTAPEVGMLPVGELAGQLPVVAEALPAAEVSRTVTVPGAAATPTQPDDLKLIEGIGPKIASILNAAGISTFAQVAVTEAPRILEILGKADPRLLRLADPTTWAEQAALAAKGDLEGLRKLQDALKGGRRVG